MHWINPPGAWALASLGIILCLYFLKQKMEPVQVSSTWLWQKAVASLEADRPFQRLRRNLLMLIQLFLALLLAFSLMRPMTVGGEVAEVIFLFDVSASMQAEDGGVTRLATAVGDAARRIDGLTEGARISILTAGALVSQPVSRTEDRQQAKRALNALKPQNGSADLEGALSLAAALQRELAEAQLIVYTDQELPEGNYLNPPVGPGLANRAVLSLQANDVAAVARVANYGGRAEITLECYADESICDIRTVQLQRDEVASVQFALPGPAQTVAVQIMTKDALLGDNRRSWVRRESSATTVLLAGRDNIFLEKALRLRADITVLKTTAEEAALVNAGALTVLDGPVSDLPPKSALFLIDPDIKTGERQSEPIALKASVGELADRLNEYLQVDSIQVARWKPVEGGVPIWEANGLPILSIFEDDGRRTAVLGFDLHASNLPLLKEFPIFIQHLLEYLAPEPLTGFSDGDCGVPLPIAPQSFAADAVVISPSGKKAPIPLTGGVFSDTDEIGVYRFVQTDDEGKLSQTPFTLHIPAAESNLQDMPARRNGEPETGRGSAYGREWTPLLILLSVIMMLLEWWVYRRVY